MPIAQALLPEFDHEMATTRTVLERIPEAKANFRPHPKSWTLGELGAHLANLPVWATMALTGRSSIPRRLVDPPRKPPGFESVAKVMLQRLDANVAAGPRHTSPPRSDADLMVAVEPQARRCHDLHPAAAAVLRAMVLSHMIHHRGQLTVYLPHVRRAASPGVRPTADT